MGNILNVAPKIGNINPPTLIIPYAMITVDFNESALENALDETLEHIYFD